MDLPGGISLELPESLIRQEGAGVDSRAALFEGDGLAVLVDQGPFADSLTTHVGRPEYAERMQTIAGVAARTLFYRAPEEGGYVMAAHLPDLNRLTVVVRARDWVTPDAAESILQGIRRTSECTPEQSEERGER